MTTINNVEQMQIGKDGDVSYMFNNCPKLVADCSGWDVPNVTKHDGFNVGSPGVILPSVWQTDAASVAEIETASDEDAEATETSPSGSTLSLSRFLSTLTGATLAYADEVAKIYADREVVVNLTDVDGATVHLYAIWAAISYKVAYNPNSDDANGTTASSSHVYDKPANLTANGFTRTGYTFAGWNTKADGTGTSYADKQEVVNLTTTRDATVTLYAIWVPNVFTVSFEGNGATSGSMADDTFTYDIAENLSPNAYSYDVTATFVGNGGTPESSSVETERAFAGWNDRADGTGDAYADKQEVMNLTDLNFGVVNLFAQWKTAKVTLPAAPAYGDMIFTGWHTAATGGKLVGQPGDIVEITENVTYYAQWKKDAVVFVYADGVRVLEEDPQADGTYTVTDAATAAATKPNCDGLNGWYTDPDCTVPYVNGTEIDGEVSIYTRNMVTVRFAATNTSVIIGRSIYADAALEEPVTVADLLPDAISTYYGEVIAIPSVPAAYFGDAGRIRCATAAGGAYANPNASGSRMTSATVLGSTTLYYDWQTGGYDGILTD